MTKGFVRIHGLGYQTSVGRNATHSQIKDGFARGIFAPHRMFCITIASHPNRRGAYMYFGDLPDWSHFGEVRIHTGISREIE